MNDTNALYIGMQFNILNNVTSYGIILIMCILLIETFHIKYMHSRMPISLYCNQGNQAMINHQLITSGHSIV